jgi:hypothetical protein
MTHFLYPAVERALVFDFPALRLSLNRAEDQVERSIGIGRDRSCELHRHCNRAGPAKSLGAWLRAAENGATVAQLEAIFG